MKQPAHILWGALLVLVLPVLAFALNTITTGFQVGAGQVTIDAHGVCQKVSATDGRTYFVPTNTASEWSSFRTNKPSGVTLGACCSGTVVGGYCWYLGASAQSCDAACSTHGGTNIAGTNGYAGAGGTNAQCQLVMNALDQPYTYVVSDNSQPGATAAGCGKVYVIRGERRRYLVNPTTGSATYPSFRRACACNN